MKTFLCLCTLSLLLASCATYKTVTFDNATKGALLLNISGIDATDLVVINPEEGAELRFEESFPPQFTIDRSGRHYRYHLTMDPSLLDESALIVGNDMKIYLVQNGKVRNPQPKGFPLVPR